MQLFTIVTYSFRYDKLTFRLTRSQLFFSCLLLYLVKLYNKTIVLRNASQTVGMLVETVVTFLYFINMFISYFIISFLQINFTFLFFLYYNKISDHIVLV